MHKLSLFVVGAVGLMSTVLMTGCGIHASKPLLSASQHNDRSQTVQPPVTTPSPVKRTIVRSSSTLPTVSKRPPDTLRPGVRVTNSSFGFYFQLLGSWKIQSHGPGNLVTYVAPDDDAVMKEYGYAIHSSSAVTQKLANVWRLIYPPYDSYFANGTRGAWYWAAESGKTNGRIYYALIYMDNQESLSVLFTYPTTAAHALNPVIAEVVKSFVP